MTERGSAAQPLKGSWDGKQEPTTKNQGKKSTILQRVLRRLLASEFCQESLGVLMTPSVPGAVEERSVKKNPGAVLHVKNTVWSSASTDEMSNRYKDVTQNSF